MVRIITGAANSGKSTKFFQLFQEKNNETGLYSLKLYNDDNTIIGYNLVLLPIDEEIPFISLRESVPAEDTDKYYYQGRFALLKETFEIAERYILNSPDHIPVWIDEVGKLELKGVGYDKLLHKLVKSDRDMVITVKDSLLDQVLNRYEIKEYRVIEYIV